MTQVGAAGKLHRPGAGAEPACRGRLHHVEGADWVLAPSTAATEDRLCGHPECFG